MDGPDLELFERSVRNATERHTGAALDEALDELGWPDALAADPAAAVSVLFERQGAANATSSTIDRVLLAGLGIESPPSTGVVLPALGRWDPPGVAADGAIRVRGIAGAGLRRCDTALVVVRSGEDDVAIAVPTDALERRTVAGLDPSLELVEVTGDLATGDAPHEPLTTWAVTMAAGQRAIADELVGASRRMLELAREHALDRVQFGVPISTFQAVRHRLADTLVAIETADAVVGAAWQDGTAATAAMAKAVAGRSARTAARHCQQVLAGIGFTTEHPLHHSVRRILVLDELFGASRTLTRALGDDVLASRRLPAPLPL